ncbi:MAG TPA: hypothetical protein VM802_23765 [Chitinophaga sp.]|uniref:hypothetical protein n=1 Tax=Chitinophaga sp. TaxID=1869181 RepID=UPI002CAC572E|nr:hypothetical protein [Chitinophaga sp.]HVI47906.1 hypothetical protein [Chitinophaga sp.]
MKPFKVLVVIAVITGIATAYAGTSRRPLYTYVNFSDNGTFVRIDSLSNYDPGKCIPGSFSVCAYTVGTNLGSVATAKQLTAGGGHKVTDKVSKYSK